MLLRILGWFALVVANASDGKEPTDKLIPSGYQGNPWGPVATKARESGGLPPIPMTTQMEQWDRWGKANLREGDIVFRRGNAKVLFGYFPFSRFIANCSGSKYSHTGVVAIENGEPFIYDTTKASVRRQPFYIWTLDNAGPFGLKRLKPDYRSHIPDVMAFCHKVFEEQVPFDYGLDPGDDELYCVEMTEKAFRAAGLALSEPVRLGDMERAAEFPICMFVFHVMSDLTLEKPLTIDQPVFFPGNDRHGIWSSQFLETVYPPPTQREAAAAKGPKTR
jgi:permuted papain-like amidase YaeF/Yiix C92 family enzyme